MTKTLWAVLVAGSLAVPAWAQNVDEGDDPDHGVARISLLNGDVTVQRGDSGEVVAADLNSPLVALDHVLTGPGARAEIQFDYANMIRLGPVSEVRITELRDNDYFIQVAEGTTTFRILRDTNAQIEISTPTVSIRPVEKGVYRITVRPDGATEVTVRGGEAQIFTPRGMETLRNGKTLQARGTAQDPEFMIANASGKDDWDRWNEDRDRDLERSKSYQYVSRDVYGADDLDNHGRWVYDAPYGNVWVPNVTTTWAPYRVGRWSWVNYYGWTWISGDPWGWAPYHYGSWYSSSYGWAWYPGAMSSRYYWRPALVSFFGWGNGSVNIGVGFGGGNFGYGNVGWVPLAPYEIYNPWYGPRYRNNRVTNITVINNVNIVNVYRNARQFNGRNGVTSVQAGNFGRGRVNNDNYVRVNNTDLTRAGRVQGQVPFNGDKDSRRYSDRTPAPEVAARANNNRDRQFATANVDRSRRGDASNAAVVSRPSANPTPSSGGTVDRGQGNRTQTNAPDRAGVSRGATATQSAPQSDGWRRFDPSNSSGNGASVDRGSNPRGADVRAIGGRNANTNPGQDSGGFNDTRSRRSTEVAPRAEQPRSAAPVDNGSTRSRRDSQPVQINPPIVRDRGNAPAPRETTRSAAPSAPQVDRGNRGGGAGPSAPSAPAQSAPPSSGGSIRSNSGGNSGGGQRGAASAPAGNGGGNDGGGDRGRRR